MNFVNEMRYAVRSLTKSPVFTVVAVLSLALGIGANTAVFTLLDQVLLRMLPVRDPQQLVQLKEVGSNYGSNTGLNALSYPMYKDFSEQNQVFSGMLCRHWVPLSVSFGGRTERASGELVSGTYFDVLGVRPHLGRLFNANDDRTRSGAPYAVLGYDFWQSRFASDPNIVGKQILVNSHQLAIIGVAPDGFEGVEPLLATQIYTPVIMAEQLTQEEKPLDNRRRRYLQVFGRLKDGVTREQAKASLQPIFHRILEMEVQQKEFAHASAYTREQFVRKTIDALPGSGGHNEVRQFLEAPLWAMMGMVGLVLLIACANVANLFIARATSRQKEIAVRLAMGASRGRLVRQLFFESLLIAVLGGGLSIAITFPSMRLLRGILPDIDPPMTFATHPDLRMLAFTLGISLLTALIFGLAPALQATRPDLAPTLKDNANAVSGGSQALWRRMLVCAQVSLSLLLLIAAGLFVRTLKNMRNLSPGFEVSHLVSFNVEPTLSGYNTERSKIFFRQLQDRLASTPGVRSAALAVVAPLSFDEWDSTVTIEGYSAKPGEDVSPWDNYVSPGFFETLKIPLYSGRDFSDRDRGTNAKVAIVNEKFARRYFGNQSPIGRHLGMGGDPGTKTDIEIIGMVRDTKYQTMREDPPRQVYFPYLQNDWATAMTAYVRSDVDSATLFPVLRGVVRSIDPSMPVYQVKTEEKQVDDVLAVERLSASLASAFGLLATLLASIGLYGVMAFLVTRRTREIGIRMALGAFVGDVIWIVLREVMLLVGIGVLIGLPAALTLGRLLQKQLFGMSPYDPVTIGAALLGILLVAALSGYLPARRATRVDPLIALRYE
jgi:predicted permease